jgi:hypothetical protein
MRREDFPDRPWPWELRAYLPPSEPWEFRDSEGLPLPRPQVSTLRVFLPRTNAVQFGLLPALESPQAVANEELPSPDEQLNDPAVGIQALAHAQSPPEQPEAPPPAPAQATHQPAVNVELSADLPEGNRGGGRPTDRDLLLSEADWRLRHEHRPKTLRAFARDVLRPWLDVHGEHRGLKTQEVMKVETIEDHVRSLWNRREKPAKNR